MKNESGLKPTEFNVLIRMDPVEDRTASGLFIPPTKVERDELACDEGTLVAASPLAFSYVSTDERPAWEGEQPQVGDRVLFAQFDGRLWKRDGVTYRILKDKSIVAVIEPQPALAAAA
jgi:co-chaperonin GroES (HSP10)